MGKTPAPGLSFSFHRKLNVLHIKQHSIHDDQSHNFLDKVELTCQAQLLDTQREDTGHSPTWRHNRSLLPLANDDNPNTNNNRNTWHLLTAYKALSHILHCWISHSAEPLRINIVPIVQPRRITLESVLCPLIHSPEVAGLGLPGGPHRP